MPNPGQQLVLMEDDMDYADDFELADDDGDDGSGGAAPDEEEEVFAADDGSSQNESTNKWDRIVAALEDTLLDEQFERARTGFCRQHCHEFEDAQENKLSLFDTFQAYCSLMEAAIQQQLSAKVAGFSMAEFAGMLEQREGELDAEVFDTLLSIGDFDAFKAIMLAYKAEAAAAGGSSSGSGACGGLAGALTCCAAPMHQDEEDEGDLRPDLDMSLRVSPLVSPSQRCGVPVAAR